MFERQWFSDFDQLGLSDAALEIEYSIVCRKYQRAIRFAYQCRSDAIARSAVGARESAYWLRQLKRITRIERRNRVFQRSIKIAFANFWPGFDVNENELLNLLVLALQTIDLKVQITSADPDIVFSSCFGKPDEPVQIWPNSTHILYLGENVRPSYNYSDYSFSFDYSDYMGRNIYLPLWLLRLDPYAIERGSYEPINRSFLVSPIELTGHKNKICFVGNNMTPMRLSLMSEFKAAGFVVERYGSQSRAVINKTDAYKDAYFSFAFENSWHPGYVTEKIFDSFMGRTLPIYWGGLIDNIVNKSSFVNYDDAKGSGQLVSLLTAARDRLLVHGSQIVPLNKIELARFEEYTIKKVCRLIGSIF